MAETIIMELFQLKVTFGYLVITITAGFVWFVVKLSKS